MNFLVNNERLSRKVISKVEVKMESLLFNSHSGYLEGIIRGFKSGLITSNQYSNLTQCESLQDFKLQLSSTDYANFLSNQSDADITTNMIATKATEKLVDEFNYLKSNSVQPLTKFLDYITLVPFFLSS